CQIGAGKILFSGEELSGAAVTDKFLHGGIVAEQGLQQLMSLVQKLGQSQNDILAAGGGSGSIVALTIVDDVGEAVVRMSIFVPQEGQRLDRQGGGDILAQADDVQLVTAALGGVVLSQPLAELGVAGVCIGVEGQIIVVEGFRAVIDV